tara:strand:- start:417 stop:698 length:282 start_codon:yes stop_codon:yes gene_type:complete
LRFYSWRSFYGKPSYRRISYDRLYLFTRLQVFEVNMKQPKIQKMSLRHYFNAKQKDTQKKLEQTQRFLSVPLGEAEGGLSTPSNEKPVLIPFS